MDLADLRIFQAVVEEGGITKAARKLHRVQSNVTTRIRQLEEDLSTPLFIRDGKKLHLSPAGRTLLDYAGKLLSLAEEARGAVQDPRPRGPFRLGAMESTAAVRLPGPLAAYHQRYPEVNLSLRTGNPTQLATAVLAGELDAALATEPIAEEQFESVVVFNEPLVMIGHKEMPPIGDDTPLTAPMIAFEPGCPHRARLEQLYHRRGTMPANTIQLGSYHAMIGCVAVGMGVALLPKSVLETFPARHRLSEHALPDGLNEAATRLFWRRGARSPKIDALKDILEEGRA